HVRGADVHARAAEDVHAPVVGGRDGGRPGHVVGHAGASGAGVLRAAADDDEGGRAGLDGDLGADAGVGQVAERGAGGVADGQVGGGDRAALHDAVDARADHIGG